jgi:hypothetical protein
MLGLTHMSVTKHSAQYAPHGSTPVPVRIDIATDCQNVASTTNLMDTDVSTPSKPQPLPVTTDTRNTHRTLA